MRTDLHLIPNHIGQGAGLFLPVPVFAHVASPADNIQNYTGPEETETGIVCGDCSEGRPRQIRHASVDHVAVCCDFRHSHEMEARAEQMAEMANERWFEDRGWEDAMALAKADAMGW